MPLPAPNLDNRTFADIVAEARSLIPRYSPLYTDYNISDPGQTLIELFGWMTEMIIYRLNQVPERNYIKFLDLIGIALRPALPARTELTFSLARPDIVSLIIPKGTQVATAGAVGDEPLVFETDEALIAIGAVLKAVQAFDGFGYTVETKKNGSAGQWFHPFGPLAREGAALTLGFDSPVAFPKEQIHLAVSGFTEGLSPEGTHCDLDLNGQPVPAALQWEYWAGAFWQPIGLDKDETRAFTRSGHIYFPGPGTAAVKGKIGAVADPLYWLRARLVKNQYDMTPRLSSVAINTVRATQAQTVRDEVLGASDGRPEQTFRLANAPALALDKPQRVRGADGKLVEILSLRLEVDEGLGFQVWQEVPDFFASAPDDPHYILDRATGDVRFGGIKARIPAANPSNPANIVARLYRFGGGSGGNAGIDTITELQTFVDGVSTVTNLSPALGGADVETLAEAKLRAPHEIQVKNRCVTVDDFQFLATQTPGVRIRRAKALPLYHPKFRGTPIPGVVTVIVVPESDVPNPLPGEPTLRIVCAHLNVHRLLSSELYVVPPVYRLVRIDADIAVRPEADLAEVKHAVEDRLTQFFHPLVGWDGTGWPFGQSVLYSDVMRIVLGTNGVSRVLNNNLTIRLDDTQYGVCHDAPLCEGELLYSTGHDIRLSYAAR